MLDGFEEKVIRLAQISTRLCSTVRKLIISRLVRELHEKGKYYFCAPALSWLPWTKEENKVAKLLFVNIETQLWV